jgi:hypothetical protein
MFGLVGKAVIKLGWREMPYDKFLVWGDFFKGFFKLYNPTLSISTVGNPALDGSEELQGNRRDRILFAFQKPMGIFITMDDLSRFGSLALKTAQDFPDKTIVLRSHPDFDFEDWLVQRANKLANVELHAFNQKSLSESFKDVLACVTISSTVAFEALLSGAFPVFISLSDKEIQGQGLFAGLSPFKHTVNYEGLASLLKDLMNDYDHWCEIQSGIIKRLFSAFGEDAVERIINEIESPI